MKKNAIKTVELIFIRIENIWKDNLTFMRYLIHNIENSPLISLGCFDLFIVIFSFGRGKGISNSNFTNLEQFIMSIQIGLDPQAFRISCIICPYCSVLFCISFVVKGAYTSTIPFNILS